MPDFNHSFWTENGRALKKPNLACLRQDHNIYKNLLMQLVGEIEYDNNGIRFVDKDLAEIKFNLFFEKAIEENVDLAITPEYSCPWSSLNYIISENRLPIENKIWVVGCQSIKPQEFKDFTEHHQEIIWIYDEHLVLQNINENKFFNPVCFLFKTKDVDDVVKDVIIVQFKTHSFGGAAFEWERDNLITGDIFYIIENHRPSTKLVCMICSDSLQRIDFNSVENEYFKNSPLLLVHIQFNTNPFQENFKLYRNLIFSKGTASDWNKEIVCLNWARGITIKEGASNKIFNKYGGSALYCKTNTIKLTEERINHNHLKGLYYTNWTNKKSHVYFLNYDEFVFLIENTKPSQIDSDPAQMKRTGPKTLKTLSWNNAWNEIEITEDGFSQICTEVEDESGNLASLVDNKDIIEIERIIQLSSGEIDTAKNENWHRIVNMYSFQIDDSEFNHRNTFSHDVNAKASNNRKLKINRYHTLKNKILPDPLQLPESFSDAILKFDKDVNSKNIYLLNLHSPSNGRKGTAIFLGERTSADAKAFKAKIESLFNEDQQGKQVMIWFSDPNLEKIFDESKKPEINENVSKSPVSFKKTR